MRIAALLDTETTGLDPLVHRCIEVAVTLYDLELALPIASYANLIGSASNEAESINRIPLAALLQATAAEGVWDDVRHMVARADVILAHRAEFDRGFVPKDIATSRPWACTKFHVDWPLGKPGDHLVHLALAHGVGVLHAHRAATDVDTLARLLTRVAEMGFALPPMIEKALRPRVKVVAQVSYDDREMAKAAGFAWDGQARIWWKDMVAEDVAALPFPTRAA
jgi:DNA polymerase III subunit epsilon